MKTNSTSTDRFEVHARASMMTAGQVMDLLQISRQTLWRLGIPHAVFSRAIRFHPGQLADWVARFAHGVAHKGLPEQFLTYQEAAERLGLSIKQLRELRKSDRLGCVEFSQRMLRFDPREIDACVKRNSRISA